MILKSEEEMVEFGEKIARAISLPCCIELVGDVGTGKTTITKGIAKGLGVTDEVTSPSFMISKRYEFPEGNLVHYDFYRLKEPGIMSEDLMENLADEKTVTVVEWGDSVAELLPERHKKYQILLKEDGTREIIDENVS
ncbi:tRNA (adenosine(37)-N6)-threonylcarbamoyltransferase complex ATPase subunit type 1 TsaE [Candidatus Saccharibacteria bacterium]|nr:tRNA (adenosine(37)-N6)-threonylcarbamoyltransferase complex ATPase subunit type 1 TsaE [Candidatus Saccharibacteria bacterium]